MAGVLRCREDVGPGTGGGVEVGVLVTVEVEVGGGVEAEKAVV